MSAAAAVPGVGLGDGSTGLGDARGVVRLAVVGGTGVGVVLGGVGGCVAGAVVRNGKVAVGRPAPSLPPLLPTQDAVPTRTASVTTPARPERTGRVAITAIVPQRRRPPASSDARRDRAATVCRRAVRLASVVSWPSLPAPPATMLRPE